ncbi:MAG TPA: phosphatidylglycerol lysyltransferase domain-containing protein [Gaiellaceae bacterium]|nr:phosphatidylglycerol lysyltransferase domain-containing protein [Gaiellaceae bacterium]
MIRLERHSRGPRLYLFGRRVHEWHLGLVVIGVVVAGWLGGIWSISVWTGVALAVGAWMVVKDWRDVFPHLRDTAVWRFGLHRPFVPLRVLRYGDDLPSLVALVAFVVGVVNLASALTPNIGWRHHTLLQLEPVEAVPLFHTVAVPASAALITTAYYLRRRRILAWALAVALLVVLGVLDLAKGLDFEETAISWAAAAVLWWGREAFYVRPARPRLTSPLWMLGVATAIATVAASVTVWIAAGPSRTSLGTIRETLDLLAWRTGSVAFHDELSWLPLAVGLLTIFAILIGAALLFRPLGAPSELPDESSRRAAGAVLRRYGSDTLAFFKLRRDIHYLFSGDRQAFLGYRIENRVLLVAGDPVGPPDRLPSLVREARTFADVRGLRIGAVGASEEMLPLWREAGLRSLYIGDEAIIETARFSLEGRSIRKVRQSVNRLERDGYSVELHALDMLDPATRSELDHVSQLWRAGTPERGFSMAMDSLSGAHQDSMVVLARDAEGRVRAFLHFVPAYGRHAMSLSFMRRDRDTPNGLMEFLVVRSTELLRESGIEELSLNFAAFARLLDRPAGLIDRTLGRIVSLGNAFFQIESLYRFNAKFGPRWEPRYLVYEGPAALGRTGVAAMRAEGQLPIRRGEKRKRSRTETVASR